MSYKNTVKDYSQMIGFLTRDKTSTVPRPMDQEPLTMDQEPRIPFAKGSIKATRDYLDSLEKGATINRQSIIADTGVDSSFLTKMLKKYENKNFKFEKNESPLLGRTRIVLTDKQKELGEFLYGSKTLTDQQIQNITNNGFDRNTITDYRKSVIDKPLIQRAKDLGYKTDFKDMGYEDVRRVRQNLPPGNRVMNNKEKIRVDKEMLKLADDPRMVEIIERGTPNKNDLLIVKELLGEGVNAPNKLNQFVAAFSGDRPVDGITLKFKDNAKNILDKMAYSNYQRAMDETQTGRQFGENSLSVIKKDIKKSPLYQDAGLSKFTNIDEANAITGNSRLGTSPYGIFGQVIDKQKNSGTKMAWDGKKSTLEKQLQEAIATGDKTKINQAVIKFNKAATKAEGTLNMQKLRGAKRIRLPRVSLDDPSKTIANWKTFNSKYKDVFNKNFVDRKYSFVIPKDLRTIPELRKDVLNPKSPVYKEMINTLKQGFNEFDEKKLFKKINNATPDRIKKIMKFIPRLASVDSNFETNMFASADNIMSDATYVDDIKETFAERNPVVTGTGLTSAGTAGVLKASGTPIKSALGKVFKTLGTRAAAVPFAGYTAYDNLKKGENVADAIVDPLVGIELMLPNLFKENVAKITSNPYIQKALKFGKYGRALTPIGAGITAAGLGIDAYKYGKERKQLLDSLTDEEKTNLFRQEQSDVVKQQLRGDQNAFDEFSAAEGGIADLMKKKYD